MRRTVLLAGLALSLAFPATAFAAEPTVTFVQVHVRATNLFGITCQSSLGPFTVTFEGDVTQRVMTFADRNGTPVRQVIHEHTEGALTNSITGKALPESSDFQILVDLVNHTRTIVGQNRVDTVPGEGVVFQAVGRLVFASGQLVFEAGQQDPAERDFARLCAFLADG